MGYDIIMSYEKNQTFEIILTDKASTNIGIENVQLLKIGTFKYPDIPNGQFTITSETLRVMKANFDTNVRRLSGKEIAVDYSHKSGAEASGWINAIELRENDSQMWATINWTANAAQKITEREFRYISADIVFGYIDNETGVNHGPVLMGAGLTNRPHIKDMEIILNEKPIIKGVGIMDFEQLLEAVNQLGDEEKAKVLSMLAPKKDEQLAEKDVELEKKDAMIKESEVTLASMTKELEEVKKSNVELSEKITLTEKNIKFDVLLSEGKVVPAQKDAFMEMDLILSEKLFSNANVILNLDEKGHGNDIADKKENKTACEIVTEKAVKLSEERKIDFGRAVSIILSEDKVLEEKYNKENN